jgi:hypothetical protein
MSVKKTETVAPDTALETKSDLLTELAEFQQEQAAEAAELSTAPVAEVLQHGTLRETNTVYEDRTLNPADDPVVEYELETIELGDGTILTNVGERK